MRRLVLAVAMLALAGCSGCHHNPPLHTSYPSWDGGPIDYAPPDGPATCLDVCRNGQHLSCTWAAPTDGGAPCVEVCAHNESVGIARWDLDCRAHKTTCAAIDTCP